MDASNYMLERARFGARLFLLVAGMPRTARRFFNRFLFKGAKEMADGRDLYCKKALIAQLYNYYDAAVVTDFLFSGENKAALEAYKELPFDAFFAQYGPAMDVEWCNKTYDTFDSPTLFDDNPEAQKELDITYYQQLFVLAQERGGEKELPDFSKIGYLAFFYKSELTEDDCAMVNRLYCQGELLYDMFDFVCSEELTTAVRKRAVDALMDFCERCDDPPFVQGVLELGQSYRRMNPNRPLPVDLNLEVDLEPPQPTGEVRLLPKACWHGCDRDRFIAALERILTREGLIAAGSGRLESLFEGTREKLQPVIWKRKSYELAYFLRVLCPIVEHKEEIATQLFYYKVSGARFKVSSLKSPRCSDPETLMAKMEAVVEEARGKGEIKN